MKPIGSGDDAVRTLLQAQDEWSALRMSSPNNQDKRKKRRRLTKNPKKEAPLSEDELLQYHVRSMLAVDRCANNNKDMLKALHNHEHAAAARYRRQVTAAQHTIVVGSSSRTSSASAVHPPTSSKSKHKQEQQQASLQRIAKKLRQSKSPKRPRIA